MNTYDGCVRNDIIIYDNHKESWNKQLNKIYKKYKKLGYKVVFVSGCDSLFNSIRVVLYNKHQDIPYCMQEYNNKIVKIKRKWVSEYSLSICDNCGEYKECSVICDKGTLCDKCDRKLNYKRHLNGKYEYQW